VYYQLNGNEGPRDSEKRRWGGGGGGGCWVAGSGKGVGLWGKGGVLEGGGNSGGGGGGGGFGEL